MTKKLDELKKQREDFLPEMKSVYETYREHSKKIMEIERDIELEETNAKYREFKYKLVNGEIHDMTEEDWSDKRKKVIFRKGLPYQEDSYGMGAVHWPLLKTKQESRGRYLLENVIWATDRLSAGYSEETKELHEIIATGGKSRDNGWKNLPED